MAYIPWSIALQYASQHYNSFMHNEAAVASQRAQAADHHSPPPGPSAYPEPALDAALSCSSSSTRRMLWHMQST